MNARTFGTDDRQAEFFARYGTGSYEETGRAISEAQQSRPQVGSVAPVQSPVFVDQASDRAIDYLVSLSAKKTPWIAQPAIIAWAKSVDRRDVSAKIDELKAMADASQGGSQPTRTGGSLERHNVPAGRYAVTGNDGQTVFVKVDRPTEGQWKGRIFVKVQASETYHRTDRRTADTLLGKIAADGIEASRTRYGVELGHCWRCGRTLTNDRTRAAGIGDDCAGKL
jgi:hypothetical protein